LITPSLERNHFFLVGDFCLSNFHKVFRQKFNIKRIAGLLFNIFLFSETCPVNALLAFPARCTEILSNQAHLDKKYLSVAACGFVYPECGFHLLGKRYISSV
jgi:hypothetical protein